MISAPPSHSSASRRALDWRAPAWKALLALILGITLATGLSSYLQRLTQAESERVFEERANTLKRNIEREHLKHVRTLQTLALLLSHDPQLNHQAFRQYVASMRLAQEQPAITALLYLTPPNGTADQPSQEPTLVLAAPERLTSESHPKFGASWSQLLQLTRELGREQLSAPLNLQHELWPKPGLLLVMPVFRDLTPPADPGLRAQSLLGWVVAVLDPHVLLANLTQQATDQLDFEVFVGGPGHASLVHDQDGHLAGHTTQYDPDMYRDRLFHKADLIQLSGQELLLATSSTPKFDPGHTLAATAIFILISGLMLSSLTAWTLWRTMSERQRSQAQAHDLSEQLEVMATVAKATSNGVLITDAQQRIIWINDGLTRLTGFTHEDAMGRLPAELLASPNGDADSQTAIGMAVSSRSSLEIEILNRKKNGQDYWIRLEIRPYYNWDGVFKGFIEIETDIDEERTNNQRMQAALQENDALMHALHQHAIVSEADPKGTIIRVNERFVESSGYEREELLGKNHRILNSGHHPAEFWRTMWRDIQQGNPWRQDVCNRTKQGTLFWVDTMVIPVGASNGQIEKFVSIRFDITQRKADENTLRDNRELFKRMGDIAGVGYWFDMVGTNNFVMSEQAWNIIDADPQNPPSYDDIFNRYSPESALVLSMAIQEATQLGEPFDLELNFQSFKDRSKWLRLAATPEFRDGKLWRLIGAIQDITERVETQRRIEENDRILRSAIDAIGEAFVLYDPQDRLVFCNEKYRALYDLSNDLIVPGASFEEIVRTGAQRGQYPEATGRVEEWVAERLAVHSGNGVSVEQQLSGGRWVRVAECRTQDGYYVGFRIDITEFKHAVQQAEEASLSKSRFLANMSHEIRTPMNAILGMLQLLQTTSLTTNQADYVNKTQGAAKSLLGILNDILDFSKVEAGKMQLDPEPTVFDDMMRELGVIMASNLGQKKLELLFDLDTHLPPVLVFDALRLKQVLINLTGNAIKFTAQGEVLLKVRQTRRDDQQVWLNFAVKDSGIGISAEHLDHIFEGFSQAETSTSRRFGGTGLGLAISRRLVELMGGELAVESAEGMGSTFYFEIPLPIAPSAEAAHVPAQPMRQHNVLLVDDNPLARSVHARQLRALGCFVDSAASAAQAVEMAQTRLAREHNYDTVFLDAGLPEQDGWTTALTLHKLWEEQPTAQARPRLIMLSESDQASLLQAERMPWLDRMLSKPLTPGVLREALEPGRQAPRPVPGTGQQQVLNGLHILLVEDNPINQQVACELLRTQGAAVEVAQHGQEALDRLSQPNHPVDVVLMDMQMPVMDGLEATRAIRQGLKLTTLPIVAMTANAMPADRELCLSAGMNDHIGKPFDLQQLVRVLLRWSGRSQAAESPAGSETLAVAQPMPTEPPTEAISAAPLSQFDPTGAAERFGGDLKLYRKMLELFITDAPKLLEQVQQHWAHSRADTAAASHSLKGSAATLGLNQLAQAAAQLEQHTKQKAESGSTWPQPLLETLQHAAQQALRDANTWLQAQSADAPQRSTQTANLPQLRASLLKLVELLQASDMQSLELYDELAQAHGLNQAPEWATLNDAMTVLDFEAAAQAVDQALGVLPQSRAAGEPPENT